MKLNLLDVKELVDNRPELLEELAAPIIRFLLAELEQERNSVVYGKTSTEECLAASASMYYGVSYDVVKRFLLKIEFVSAEHVLIKLGQVLCREQHSWKSFKALDCNKPAILRCVRGNYVTYKYWNGFKTVDPCMGKGHGVKTGLPQNIDKVLQFEHKSEQ